MFRTESRLNLVTFVLAAGACAAQTSAPLVTLSGTEQRSITFSKIGQRYDLFISLPENYHTSKQSNPVLYVLDGWHFSLMAFIQGSFPAGLYWVYRAAH